MIRILTFAFAMFMGLHASLNAYYYDIQARAGGFFATSSQTKEAFKQTPTVCQLEASVFFSAPWEWVPWKAWINGSFMWGNGRSERLGRTDSNLTTLSLGLKHSWWLGCYGQFYLGAGPSLSWLRMKTDGPLPEGFWDGRWHGHRKISKKNFGAVIKSGFQVALWDYILVDAFCDYSILAFHYKDLSKKHLHHKVSAVNKIHKHSRKEGHHRLDLNGFIIGGAIGVPF